MAHLMLFYELMQVKREYNAESRNQIAITHKVNNMKKQVDRTTKYYTSLFTQLENNAKSMQNQANVFFQSMTGGYNFSATDYTGMSTLAQFIPQVIANGYTKNNEHQEYSISQETYTEMASLYQQYGRNFAESGTDCPYDTTQVSEFFSIQNGASTMQNQIKMAVSQMSSMFQNSVSSWLECQKAALTAEQDAALDALNYEETMLEIDQESSKIRCEELKAEKESLQEELKERVQDDAPKFGL